MALLLLEMPAVPAVPAVLSSLGLFERKKPMSEPKAITEADVSFRVLFRRRGDALEPIVQSTIRGQGSRHGHVSPHDCETLALWLRDVGALELAAEVAKLAPPTPPAPHLAAASPRPSSGDVTPAALLEHAERVERERSATPDDVVSLFAGVAALAFERAGEIGALVLPELLDAARSEAGKLLAALDQEEPVTGVDVEREAVSDEKQAEQTALLELGRKLTNPTLVDNRDTFRGELEQFVERCRFAQLNEELSELFAKADSMLRELAIETEPPPAPAAGDLPGGDCDHPSIPAGMQCPFCDRLVPVASNPEL